MGVKLIDLNYTEMASETKDDNPMGLTPEEMKEFKEHPTPAEITTPAQLALRQSIGKKMCDFFNKDLKEANMTEEARDVYIKYPMWRFYTSAAQEGSNTMVRRSYGVITGGKEPSLHMVSLRMFFVNHVVGGVPCSEVRALDDWTDEQKAFIKLACANQPDAVRRAFLDPLGFVYFLWPVAPK